MFIDIKITNKSDYLNETWFDSGHSNFKDLDFKKEIDLFHLNNKEVNSRLIKLADNTL